MALSDVVLATIARHGPMSFDRFVELALYHEPGGFYSEGGSAGRRGDFLTSAEVGPLFGAVLAQAMDTWWDELGQPPVFSVIECGAGPGTLARSILSAEPRCAGALRYLLVERSSRQRERHREHLRLEHPSAAFPLAHGDDEPPDAGGPITVSLADLPAVATVGVIVANELLDNLPFALCQRSASGWDEVLVGVDGDHLIEVLVEAPIGHRQLAEDLAPDAPVGARIPVQLGVWRWLAEARSTLERGRIVCFDYARSTAEMAADPGWLRTYRSQSRGVDPLIDPGTQDITTDVALDQLVVVAAPTLIRSQRDFLAAFGIEQLVESGRAVWAERAHLADLTALKARSRIREADALLDPRGLGGFTVMEWVVG